MKNMTGLTSSQTIGPFPHESWRWAFDATKATRPARATLTIEGTIYDGAGQAIDDAVLEAWTPDAAALEHDQLMPAFRRMASGALGEFRFELTAPAKRSKGEPALYMAVFARGLVTHQFTAVFLDDDAGLANSAILQQVPAARRATLIARRIAGDRYQWDIWMQGNQETVFFDYA